ncbi:peptidoglycan-binding protein [Streptomyces sp. NPDC046832]|uniref:peptidoglycan-binding domain-containing protein n=1 Tax=Streptomyces sp. NPDC046832 TaxID=3155020 RepID=UPI0033D52CCD
MEPPNGHPCPECGAPRQRDNTPTCACTHRAAEALRDARTTQAAAAEDFDPLRIRPYVEIDTGKATGGQTPDGQASDGRADSPTAPPQSSAAADRSAQARAAANRPPGSGGEARAAAGAPPGQRAAADRAAEPSAAGPPDRAAAADVTAPVPHADAVHRGSADRSAPRATAPLTETTPPASGAPPVSPADVTAPLPAVDPGATAVLPAAASSTFGSVGTSAAPASPAVPAPLTSAATEPSVTDLRMFDGAGGTDRGAPGPRESGKRRPRRRGTLLVAAAGACVAVVAAAGYATGLFSYESPSRDTALPDDIRASVPDAPSSSAAPTAPAGSATAVGPAPAAPRPSPSRSTSPSASPSPSAPSPSQSPSPSAPRTSAPATGGDQAPPEDSRQKGGPTVLRLGDRGPEVTELQLRLRQLNLYIDDADGTFDDRVEDAVRTYQWSRGIRNDDLGVYDAETRNKLESETREP